MHSSTPRNWSGLLMILLAFAGACTVKAGDSTSEPANPATACEDMADAIASKGAECGQSYQSNYDAFVNSAASGDCSRITSLRDEDTLYNDCIPFIQGLTCTMLVDPTLTFPSSCQDQLIQ